MGRVVRCEEALFESIQNRGKWLAAELLRPEDTSRRLDIHLRDPAANDVDTGQPDGSLAKDWTQRTEGCFLQVRKRMGQRSPPSTEVRTQV